MTIAVPVAPKERGIICYAHEVRALLAGQLVELRRVLTVQPLDIVPMEEDLAGIAWCGLMEPGKGQVFGCRYGAPGSRLWVRETALPDFPKEFSHYEWSWAEVPDEYRSPEHVQYRATFDDPDSLRWHASSQMPRWASRLTLTITDVRVERIGAISEAACQAEGMRPDGRAGKDPHIDAYKRFWDGLHAKDGLDWGTNPWVWVMTVTR